MRIEKIYEHYLIMPQLRQHHYRVAGVAHQIMEHCEKELHADAVIGACLLHDIGNIIKFELEWFPEFVEPEGPEYWRRVQQSYIDRYGTDEHQATYRILDELDVSGAVQELVRAVGFSRTEQIAGSGVLEEKIVLYADQRVAPTGVVSLEERLREGRERYKDRADRVFDEERFEQAVQAAIEIEAQVFAVCSITPDEITDQLIAPEMQELNVYELETVNPKITACDLS